MAAVTDIPYKFAEPWGKNAPSGYVTNPVPVTVAGGFASQDLGFPSVTATPIGAGGAYPDIKDINGLGFYTTSWNLWQQLGGPVFFDAALSTAVNGYPMGAMVAQKGVFSAWWISPIDNNTQDPDAGPSSWIDPFAVNLHIDGFQKLPSGLVMQWGGVVVPLQATTTINFPTAFLNACFMVVGSAGSSISPTSNTVGIGCQPISVSQFNVTAASALTGTVGVFFIALGW